MQILAIVVSLAIAAVGIALFVVAIGSIIATLRIGQPVVGRRDAKGVRWATMLKETLAHTRMLQWTAVGVGHYPADRLSGPRPSIMSPLWHVTRALPRARLHHHAPGDHVTARWQPSGPGDRAEMANADATHRRLVGSRHSSSTRGPRH